MTTSLDPQMEERLRQGFKHFNRFMMLMWRLGLGLWVNGWPDVGGRFMVLVHRGRKTGLRRKTPVNFALVDGDIYCTAGFGRLTDWYRNIIANPEVEVWLPNGWWAGHVEDVSDAKERLPLLRKVLIASGFAARAAGLNPHTMSDDELDSATAEYRLIRITRTQPLTGADGPGDLAWVWPLATFLLLLLIPLRRRRQ